MAFSLLCPYKSSCKVFFGKKYSVSHIIKRANRTLHNDDCRPNMFFLSPNTASTIKLHVDHHIVVDSVELLNNTYQGRLERGNSRKCPLSSKLNRKNYLLILKIRTWKVSNTLPC